MTTAFYVQYPFNYNNALEERKTMKSLLIIHHLTTNRLLSQKPKPPRKSEKVKEIKTQSKQTSKQTPLTTKRTPFTRNKTKTSRHQSLTSPKRDLLYPPPKRKGAKKKDDGK